MKTVEFPQAPLRDAPMWPMSIAAYHALGEAGLIARNTELLYGFVYRKMPKSPIHCYLLQKLLQMLLRVVPASHLLRSEQPITCADSEPEPDVSVVKGSVEDFRLEHPRTAELVIEICVTSHEYDRSKLRAYASAGVKEVWLVLAPEKQIEVHRQPGDGKFAEPDSFGPGGQLICTALPEFTLDLDALFSKQRSHTPDQGNSTPR
ncbi:MAG: Uma2 family endonuclease [Verrucomicrobiae bacterium]|nr:Uma2 family endonuclease [Verrucomicrobiae bacterium]